MILDIRSVHMKKTEAVRKAIDEIGWNTSIDELVDHAMRIGDLDELSGQYACNIRSKYGREKGVDFDNRTYESQHRRNMFDDRKIHREKYVEITKLVNQMDTSTLEDIYMIANEFHSIDQMRLFLEPYIALAEKRNQFESTYVAI